jgi:integrase
LKLLKKWKEASPNTGGSELIFSDFGGLPLNRKTCLLYFKQILREREIKTESRNLVVHSLRHTANTIYRKVLADDVLRKFTGHTSTEMTDNYDHPDILDTIALLSSSAREMENEFNRIIV